MRIKKSWLMISSTVTQPDLRDPFYLVHCTSKEWGWYNMLEIIYRELFEMLWHNIAHGQLHSLSQLKNNLSKVKLCRDYRVMWYSVVLGQVLKKASPLHSASAQRNMCGVRKRALVGWMYHWIMCSNCCQHAPRLRCTLKKVPAAYVQCARNTMVFFYMSLYVCNYW